MKKGRKKESKIGSSIQPPVLPTVEECFCHSCKRRVGYPHFSAEDKPKIFCTWFCAYRYHQVHDCGVYRIEANAVVVIDLPQSGVLRLAVNTQTQRPPNHPVRD